MSVFQAITNLAVILMSASMMMSNAGAVNTNNDRSVRIWGDISSTYRNRDYDAGESHASEWLNMSSVYASSYIWRPWFALVNGGVSYSVDDSNVSGQEPVKDKYFTGKIQLDLFPSSRFPLTAYASHSRNELDDVVFSRDISNTELGLTQQYRSQNGRHHYRGNYERNIRDDEFDSFVSDSLLLSSSNQFTNQVIYGDVQYDRVIDELQQDEAISYSITGRQSYDKGNNLTIENLLSSSVVENDFIRQETDSETAQLSSLLSWRPNNRDDLNVTGSFRISELKLKSVLQQQGGAGNVINDQDSGILNINQGVIYNYSSHILISESINGSYNRIEQEGQFTGSESAGITFTPDTIDARIGNYSWSIAATLNNLHGDVENEKTLNHQISHSLSDNYIVDKKSVLQADISQSFNYELRSLNEDAQTLDHSLSLSWNKSTINNQSVIRFLASDTRTLDTEEISFQLINLQVSGNFRINRNNRMTGNLTLQKSFQENDQGRSEIEVMNGQLDFVRHRLFQLPRLKLRSELKFSKQQSESERLISAFTTSDPESDVEWKNSLDYMIGRFEARLSLDYIKNDNEYDRLIKIQVNRSFGDL